MQLRRVVVTGMGVVSPLGSGVGHNWRRLIASESGIDTIQGFEIGDLSCKVAGQVPRGKEEHLFDPDRFVLPKDQRKMDPFIQYGIAAAAEAVKDSGYVPPNDEARERAGVMIGAGIGGLPEIYDTSITLKEKGAKRVSPFFIPASLINLAAGQVSIMHGYRGPNHAVVTACASGAHAIGDAGRLIALGDADVMLAGGAESAVCRIGIAGFCALRALSTSFNDTPKKASRPFDKDRDGFVMGEGAAILTLEEYEHAKKRGARIYAELIGYGLSGDAFHMTAPAEDGSGAFRAMRGAMKWAQINTEDVDYVNAHGTSTPRGDEIECGAVRRILGDAAAGKIMMSSTKSAVGHLLGAAGALEAVYSIMACNTGIVPPTLNLDNPDDTCAGIDLVPHKAKEKKVRIAMSNSFGFGGTNASLIFRGSV